MPLTRDPLAAAEHAARLVEATAMMRHDVRNKLASVKNASYYLQRKSEQLPVWQEDRRFPSFFTLIDTELGHADRLLGGGTGPATLFVRNPVLIDPAACVESAVAHARLDPAHSVAFEDRFESGLGRVLSDPDELAVALRCLVENAAEASPARGVVTLSMARDGDKLVIDVSDEGTAPPLDQRVQVFEPFHSTKPGHVGLGLPVAIRHAKRLNGSLVFVEAPRTTLRMSLPAKA